LFVHQHGVIMDGFRELKPGQRVEFRVVAGIPGDQAVDVRVV
jgi:cold shock CspA family protein